MYTVDALHISIHKLNFVHTIAFLYMYCQSRKRILLKLQLPIATTKYITQSKMKVENKTITVLIFANGRLDR